MHKGRVDILSVIITESNIWSIFDETEDRIKHEEGVKLLVEHSRKMGAQARLNLGMPRYTKDKNLLI